jgi:hypothetical protein
MSKEKKDLELKFDPQTIKHLGLRMYSTLPPAIAELISNAYDADASRVVIRLNEGDNQQRTIEIIDDGESLSYDEINEKFLVIGRNRRLSGGDTPSRKFARKPTGKKGLGKLALFGLANTIKIKTVKDGKLNEFILDWEKLAQAASVYKPEATIVDQDVSTENGTTFILYRLKRASSFSPESLADSLSKIFIFDENFQVIIETSDGHKIPLDNKRKYGTITKEFEWIIAGKPYIPSGSEYEGKINGELITTKKPLSPQSGLRGVTLFSRGKLVNMPEFFSNSTSSHFFQYLTGWLNIDFIDELEEDVISTNRQSLDWEDSDMKKLREFLAGIVSQINHDWRKKRKNLSKKTVAGAGIDTKKWLSTMPPQARGTTKKYLKLWAKKIRPPKRLFRLLS